MDQTLPFSDAFVVANGLRLHYLTWGSPSHQPLVLLHGGRQEAHIWDQFSRAMAGQFYVLALDLRGHGDSDRAPDRKYDHGTFAQDLHDTFKQLGLHGIAVVGHSLGAHVAIRCEWQFPGTLSRFVIVDVAPDRNPERMAEVARDAAQPPRFRDREHYLEVVQRARPWRTLERHLDQWQWSFRQDGKGGFMEKAEHGFLEGSSGDYSDPARFEARWIQTRAVGCPTLIVRGGLSRVLLPETAERMVREMPDARLVTIPGGGHNVHFDFPAEFLQVVRPFLLGQELGQL